MSETAEAVAVPEKTKAEVAKQEQAAYQNHLAGIGETVMMTLGTPTGFQRVKVSEVGKYRYRVNIYALVDQPQGTTLVKVQKIVDSFYLSCDRVGKVESSNPPLKKKY